MCSPSHRRLTSSHESGVLHSPGKGNKYRRLSSRLSRPSRSRQYSCTSYRRTRFHSSAIPSTGLSLLRAFISRCPHPVKPYCRRFPRLNPTPMSSPTPHACIMHHHALPPLITCCRRPRWSILLKAEPCRAPALCIPPRCFSAPRVRRHAPGPNPPSLPSVPPALQNAALLRSGFSGAQVHVLRSSSRRTPRTLPDPFDSWRSLDAHVCARARAWPAASTCEPR
ncbi:hypothetical protein BC834DRAFT_95603 [Gloeopeniophorella convolvens]|nr:hypothetical protein BC834DRAFT_95603 [Gloeopeniophorella convolvens]